MENKVIGNIILEGARTAEDTVIIDGAKSKRVVAEATLQDVDVENRNRRIYEKKEMEPEVNGPRLKELISAGYLLSEMGHPLAEDLVRQQTIDPKNSCCRIIKVWMDGNLIKGHYMGTNNDYGETIDRDLRDGYKPAFSLRALGAIENVNGKAYVRGVKIITWDFVCYPSHKAAYTSKIVTESGIETPNKAIITEGSIEDTGKIIPITGKDAQNLLSILQRESANVSTILDTFEGVADRVILTENGKLKLTTRFGENIYLNLEDHIDNLIMNYVYKM